MEVTAGIEAVPVKASAAKTLCKSRKGKDFPAELTAAQVGQGGGYPLNQFAQSLDPEAENPSLELKERETAALTAVSQGETPAKETLASLLFLFPDGDCLETGKETAGITEDRSGTEIKNNAYMKMESSFSMAMESGSAGEGLLPAEAFTAAEMVALEEPSPEKDSQQGCGLSEQGPLNSKRASPPEKEINFLAVRDEGIKIRAGKENSFLCSPETGKETGAGGELKRGKAGQSLAEQEGTGLKEGHDYTLFSDGIKTSSLFSAGEARYDKIKEVVFKPLFTEIRSQKSGAPGDGEIRVSLKPDFLGQVSIRLSRQEGLMKGVIIVETALVREVIESHLPEFKQRLVEQDLHMAELTVSLEDSGEGQSGNGYSSLWRDCLYLYPGPRNLQMANGALMEWETPQGKLNILV